MKMRCTPIRGGLVLLLFLAAAGVALAQETHQLRSGKLKVKKHTQLERYEPEMVIPAEDRIRLKKERIATVRERREILDTLDISKRKKKRLLKELYNTPFTEEWDKVLADLQPKPEKKS